MDLSDKLAETAQHLADAHAQLAKARENARMAARNVDRLEARLVTLRELHTPPEGPTDG